MRFLLTSVTLWDSRSEEGGQWEQAACTLLRAGGTQCTHRGSLEEQVGISGLETRLVGWGIIVVFKYSN